MQSPLSKGGTWFKDSGYKCVCGAPRRGSVPLKCLQAWRIILRLTDNAFYEFIKLSEEDPSTHFIKYMIFEVNLVLPGFWLLGLAGLQSGQGFLVKYQKTWLHRCQFLAG